MSQNDLVLSRSELGLFPSQLEQESLGNESDGGGLVGFGLRLLGVPAPNFRRAQRRLDEKLRRRTKTGSGVEGNAHEQRRRLVLQRNVDFVSGK